MQKPQVYLSNSLHRAQNFLVAHAEQVGPANSSEARRQLDQSITAMDAAVVEQHTSAREVKGEVHRRYQLERMLVRKFVTPLSKFARASLVGAPDFVALTPSAQKLERDRLVNAARSMVTAAEKYSAQLTAAKFPANFLAQFRAAVDAIGASLELIAAKRVARTGSTKRIASAASQGRRAIAQLDSVVSHLILGDDRLEREWRAAKRVQRVGAVSVEESVVDSATTPVSSNTSEVKAA